MGVCNIGRLLSLLSFFTILWYCCTVYNLFKDNSLWKKQRDGKKNQTNVTTSVSLTLSTVLDVTSAPLRVGQCYSDNETVMTMLKTPKEARKRLLYVDGGYYNLLGTIKVPVEFLPNYKNPCWYELQKSTDLQCLPYFYLLGYMKAGTTDLYAALRLHPDIATFMKEPHWLSKCHFNRSDHYCNRNEWTFQHYLNIMKTATDVIHNVRVDNFHPVITGDFSSSTMHDNYWSYNSSIEDNDILPYRNNAELLRLMNPNVKLMVSLRNPITRLYSEYCMNSHANSPENFHERVLFSLDLFKKCLSIKKEADCIYDKTNNHLDKTKGVYIANSIYVFHYRMWLSVFPKKQILTLKFEEYAKNRLAVLKQIYDFLELRPLNDQLMEAARDTSIKNQRRKLPMLTKTRLILEEFYQPYNKELASLLEDTFYLWN